MLYWNLWLCSIVLRRGFLIQCAILLKKYRIGTQREQACCIRNIDKFENLSVFYLLYSFIHINLSENLPWNTYLYSVSNSVLHQRIYTQILYIVDANNAFIVSRKYYCCYKIIFFTVTIMLHYCWYNNTKSWININVFSISIL